MFIEHRPQKRQSPGHSEDGKQRSGRRTCWGHLGMSQRKTRPEARGWPSFAARRRAGLGCLLRLSLLRTLCAGVKLGPWWLSHHSSRAGSRRGPGGPVLPRLPPPRLHLGSDQRDGVGGAGGQPAHVLAALYEEVPGQRGRVSRPGLLPGDLPGTLGCSPRADSG